MDRVIYVPQPKMIEAAKEKAQKLNLPVATELPEHIVPSRFDTPCVVEVPINHYVDYNSPYPKEVLWKLTYVNEFTDVSNAVGELLEIEESHAIKRKIGLVAFAEHDKHRIVFFHRFAAAGYYAIRLKLNNETLCDNVVEIIN